MASTETSHASAPGKFILFGEHAVVYGEPALAAPLQSMRAHAHVSGASFESANGLFLTAEDISLSCDYSSLIPTHPLAKTISLTMQIVRSAEIPRAHLRLSSTIPISAGLGSSAATAAAVAQALARYLKRELTSVQLSRLVFDVETLHHGTPSGVDNTVIAYNQPVYFIKGKKAELLDLAQPLYFILADSGKRSSTKDAVAAVQQRYQADRAKYQTCFHDIGTIAREARDALASGDSQHLGELMQRNHELLRIIGVSCTSIDRLIETSLRAGASGAKLSGAGLGGHIIAHVNNRGQANQVVAALNSAGARSVTVTELTSGTNDC